MNNLLRVYRAPAAILLGFAILASVEGRSGPAGSLSGFDHEAVTYIVEQSKSGREPIFGWLIPFCTDLRPYERDYLQDTYSEAGLLRFRCVALAARLLQPAWLPEGWNEQGTASNNPWPAEQFLGTLHSYWRVPNTIVPVMTVPSRAPLILEAWEYQKGDARFTVLSSWKYHVVMIHRDGGLGAAAGSAAELTRVRDSYFRYPPGDLTLPADWSSEIEVTRREGRFLTGFIRNTPGGPKPSGLPNTWQGASSFFFDGSNFAFLVTAWSQGRAETFPRVYELDIDWSDPRFKR